MEKQKKNQNKWPQKKPLKNYQKIKINLKNELGLNVKKDNLLIIPIFIPHLGCKNQCIFCNQRKISGHGSDVNLKDIRLEIEKFLKLYKDSKQEKQIAFFGGSFTGLDTSEQKKFLELANEYINKKMVKNIRVSTRPDYITDEILEMLKKYNVEVIELGVQSMDDEVLKIAKRGHTAKDVRKASCLIKKYKFKLGHQIILGLPKSDLEKEIYTINECVKLKPKYLRIYPLYTLEESKLYEMYKNGEYKLIPLDEMVKRASIIYQIAIKNGINVIRIGLQTTEEINESNKSILGPVTNNYRELVLSNISKDMVMDILKKKLKNGKNVVIYIPKNQINFVVGYKRKNIKEYEKEFKVKVICKGIN